jgi:hypothetical protein
VHQSEGFLVAELGDDIAGIWSLEEALARPGRLGQDVAQGGWFCRFYSRLSPADALYLESTLDAALAEKWQDGDLVAVSLDFRPHIALFLFALEDGLYEIILMPWEGAAVTPEAITLAAVDVLNGIVPAVGWSPHAELRRFADEL